MKIKDLLIGYKYSFDNLSAGEGIINIPKWLSAGARSAFRPEQGARLRYGLY